MDGLLESFSSLCVRRTMRQKRVHRACFVSLFTPSPSFRCCLPVSHSSLSSHSIYISHSLLSYSKGLLFKFERFFPLGKDTGYSSPRFNDYAAFWCGSNDTDEYLIWYWMWILEGAVESGKWKFRVNTTLVDTPCKRKFLSTLFALSSRVISIPLFNIPDQSFVN